MDTNVQEYIGKDQTMQNYVLMWFVYMKLHRRLCSIQLDNKLEECRNTNIIMIVTIMKIKLQNIQKYDSIDKLKIIITSILCIYNKNKGKGGWETKITCGK